VLFARLGGAERVVQVSGSAGSGKTFLLRSWIAAEQLDERAAWVSVGREEHDPQAFWLSVLDALRRTRIGSERVRDLTAAPGLDGVSVVRRLVADLGSLDERVWLVIDDLHELHADEAIREVELLLTTAPPELRIVLITRRDVPLGLHRVRVEGELTEIRGEDLRFTLDESRALLQAARVRLPDDVLATLVATTEGWAAGLRLAALTMTGDPDPERIAAGFSGRERAVAEYLLAEVLDRQPEDVRRLLLRTSILERVSGPLADLLTGHPGSERILLELEDAGAFVVSLDAERSWFRYHHLFAELLTLELRRSVPEELPGLHATAADWLAEHGHPVQAVRHAQAAERWDRAAQLLADNWFALTLDGRLATARELLSRFPAGTISVNPELAVLEAAAARLGGSLDEAARYLRLAERTPAAVPEDRRRRYEIALSVERLRQARERNDVRVVADEAQHLLAAPQSSESIELGLGEDLRTSVLTERGIAEMWAGRFEDAEQDLERALADARRIGRPMLELQAQAYGGFSIAFRSLATGGRRAKQAIELAHAHGWEETAPAAAVAYVVFGSFLVWCGRLTEAESWLDRAEGVLEQITDPLARLMLYGARGLLEAACGRHAEAAAAYREVERMEGELVMPHTFATRQHALKLETLVALGETEHVEQALAEMDDEVRETSQMRVVLATLKFAQSDPEAVLQALAPILDVVTPLEASVWEIKALLLEAIAHDALRDHIAASRALERALDCAEPGGLLLPFLVHPAPALLQQQLRLGTSHASLISEILNLLAGHTPSARPEDVEPLREPLSESELRVLRYLPTNLRAPDIASELFVSLNTIRTHLRHAYAKLGVHTRADAVNRARELGLLSPSSRLRK